MCHPSFDPCDGGPRIDIAVLAKAVRRFRVQNAITGMFLLFPCTRVLELQPNLVRKSHCLDLPICSYYQLVE